MFETVAQEDGRSDALAVVVCYNTRTETGEALSRIPAVRDFDVLVVDDGSTDGTAGDIGRSGLRFVQHERNRGLGAAIKTGIRNGLDGGYRYLVVLAGNNKDDPSQIPSLLEAVRRDGYDYVQGSRFLPGGSHENLPKGRHLLVRLHALLVRGLTGFPATDAINGFRAYRLALFRDERIDIWQDWLDRYEFESYLHYKVLTLGYRVREVAVSKTYPPGARGVKYSHIRPVVDWWKIVSPLLLLRFGLRR